MYCFVFVVVDGYGYGLLSMDMGCCLYICLHINGLLIIVYRE